MRAVPNGALSNQQRDSMCMSGEVLVLLGHGQNEDGCQSQNCSTDASRSNWVMEVRLG